MRIKYVLMGGLLLAAACQSGTEKKQEAKKPAKTLSLTEESERANRFFDRNFDQMVGMHPIQESTLGIKTHYSDWDDISDEFAQKELDFVKKSLDSLKGFFYEKLDHPTQVSYKLFERVAKERIERFQYRFHNYPVNQEDGLHADLPTFLINVHRVDSISDAKAYIARLHKVKPLFDQLIRNIEIRTEKGIIPPRFVFPKAIGSCQNIIKGAPFDKGAAISDLMQDINMKIDGLKNVDPEQKAQLQNEAREALLTSVKPAYQKLIAHLQELQKKATNDPGAWKFPEGDNYYAFAVRQYTTTAMSPEDIYQLGEREVARIHGEIHAIMKRVKFRNDNLQDFLKFMTTDQRFFYPNTEPGRQRYLDEANMYIDGMRKRLDEIFITKPKAPLVVKRVEPFREKSTGGAFYNEPAPDGSRPGRFYANLSDMGLMPIYQLEALAYHEAIPGHHMQIAIAQELQGVPKFRKFGDYTAYSEGWGLYTERLGKEMGFYTDPYQDFGRLSMELLRAARCVVDPGIHHKKWTREQAIKYFVQNTAEPPGECVKAIERYIVWPGQATAYKVGMNRIMDLREKAKKDLGDKFSLREFHEVVLTAGPVPMDVLEELVNEWVKGKKK